MTTALINVLRVAMREQTVHRTGGPCEQSGDFWEESKEVDARNEKYCDRDEDCLCRLVTRLRRQRGGRCIQRNSSSGSAERKQKARTEQNIQELHGDVKRYDVSLKQEKTKEEKEKKRHSML